MIGASGSLFDSGAPDVFASCADWFKALLSGSLATSLAIISIACIGFLLLRGRLRLDRAALVLVGAFMIMGAGRISSGIFDMIQGPDGGGMAIPTALPQPAGPLTSSGAAQSFDPYAGASVPQQQ